ncbi:MAG: ATP synthase F1 subunit delta [Chthonomonas sp.]|nr:ATP synthase F1 subunit delta [Chthonomonas sp.]
MDQRVALRYAQALFNAAKKQGVVGAVGDDLNAIGGAIQGEPRLAKIIGDQDTPRHQKQGLLERLFSDRVTSLTMQVLRLMLEKKREGGLLELRDAYDALRKEDERVLSINVVSARELTADQKQRIEKKIADATKKSVTATYEIEPKVQGGVKVELGGYVIDGTVTGGLNRLRETLKYDFLNQR